ncbi:glycosyltransferase [Burkholderia sp. Bp8998]|uniref:glycosyltransferase n=1 Tax=Burkholderia sp. Bp8998 TaxID=2184557 RepID=UPI000F5AD11C|nr:glycosyltransferase [Burkholderia sp. Bp8998]RQS08865.1 glycosyltransferase [Burkholderia sp. Bp8998]
MSDSTILVNMISLFQGGPKTVGFGVIAGLDVNSIPKRHFIFILPRGVGFEGFIRDKHSTENIEYIFVGYPTKRFRFIVKLFIDHVYTPYVFYRKKSSLLFMTANFASFLVPGRRQIVLQHNPFYLEERSEFMEISWRSALRLKLEKALFRATTLKGARYIVQLDCIKKRLASRFRVKNTNIKVVTMVPLPSSIETDEVEQTKSHILSYIEAEGGTLNLFFPARLHPNKNHEILLPLAEHFKKQGLEIRFFVTLEQDCSFLKKVKERGLDGGIKNLGYVNHTVVGEVYSLFDGMFFPTYSESYGLPYVEAMKAGVPIITADYDFSREVCGDAAIYFKQNDLNSAIGCIERLCDPSVRELLISEAVSRGEKFSHDWVKVVQSIFEKGDQ